MTHDIPYAFRQESNFFFLTGFQEPDSLLCIERPAEAEEGMFTLFVRRKNPDDELWHGAMAGVDGAKKHFGCAESFNTDEIGTVLAAKLRPPSQTIFYKRDTNTKLDELVLPTLIKAGFTGYQNSYTKTEVLRSLKTTADVSMLQHAADISNHCYHRAMQLTRPGLSEHHVFALMQFEAQLRGAQHLAYPPVVAGGCNGLSLHYIANTQLLRDGDLLLVDAGAEFHGYTSDVTRTWPVNGKYTDAQRKLYEAVLEVQQTLIGACWGCKYALHQLQSLAMYLLAQKLIQLGIIQGFPSADKVPVQTLSRFYPHNIGHAMGWDIHEGHPSRFEPNMVTTIEPGLYIPKSEDVPPEFRGLCVRIEDNIVLTEGEPLVLTRAIPKSVVDIEALMADRSGTVAGFADYVHAAACVR